MKLRNLMGAFLALAGLAFGGVAAAGDIYEIRPCDSLGITIDPPGPNEYMQGGDTAYFKVRLQKRTREGKQFHLVYKGTGESIDEIIAKKDFTKLIDLYMTHPVEIGIFVSGEFRTAQYVTENYLSGGDFTDFIFSYTAKPGDFALPIRLADADKKIINNSENEPSKAYYFNFRDPALGTPTWDIDDSGTGVVEVHPAEFLYGNGYIVTPPDGDQVKDYNLTKCNFQIKSTDFAPNDPEDSPVWRVVYEGAGVSNAVSAKLVVAGVPQESQHLNLWSEDETAFYVEGGQLTDIHFNGPDKPAEQRHVLTIDIVAGKSEYEFKLRGVTRGMVTNLVLSAFKDYSYYTYMLAPVRVNDYLVKQVAVCDPQPPSVSVKVGRSPVVAKDGGHTNKVTEVLVEFSQPYDQDVEIEIKPAFTDPSGKADYDWYDYLRFSARENENVALQEKDVYTNFPKVVIKAGQTKPSSVNGEAIYNGAVYLYAIYGDKFSDAETGCFKIGIDTKNAAAKKPSSEGGIDGWTLTDPLVVQAADPSLSSKKATLSPTVNTDCAFDLKVSDAWTALKSAEGYKLYYQNKDPGFDPTDNDWKEVEAGAVWKPDAAGILKGADGKSPALKYPLAQTYVTWFYVEGPNGKTSGKEADNGFSVTVVASKANTVTAWVSADDQATWVKTGRFDEGTDFYVTVELEKPIPSGETVYAFLAPVGEAVNFVSGDAVTNSEYTSGVEIPGGETAKEAMVVSMFTLTDGTLKGQQLKFDVILCKTQQFDPLQKVDGCQSVTLTLYARNIAPAFKQVTMDKVAKVENPEETMHTGSGKTEKTALVPIGVKKTFEVKVNEPSSVDLRATGAAGADSTWTKKDFTIEYTIAEENGATDAGELTGNPASTNFTYTFTGSGTATVTLRMHDKDMDDWTDEFSFYVEVTAQASVVIDSPESIDETMTGYSLAPINLSLSDFGTASVTAKVSVACNETTEKDPKKLGFVRIGGAINSEPYVDEDGDEYYLVELVGGKARLFVDEADGTDVSNRKGFTITAAIVDTRTDPVTKKPWKDYYLSESRILYVANAAPALLDCTLGNTVEEGNTNATKVGIGEIISVEYRVEDIIADLTNGIKVQWWDTDNKNAAVTNVYSSTNLCMFSTKFKSSGPKTIRVTLTDKDSKPTYVGEWNFLVESTKTLVTIANGPGQGPSTLSARYAGAKGAGEGHVWSDASFAFADNFWINWNCNPSAMSANVFGWGYKTNAVDNGTLDSGTTYQHDIPLGSRTSAHGLGGNTTESGKSALDDCYKYAGAVDSFLYGWIYHASGTDGGSGTGGGSVGLTSTFQALAPERTERGAAGTSAPLPNADNNAKAGSTVATITYPTVYMEAVFAKEFLPSDNMGDINADGIPDLYLLVSDYDFGIVDPATGELTGNDLRDLNFTDGEDPEPYCLDYLPTTETAAYSHLIPGLPESWGGETGTGKPFIPRLKIRGFDETDPIAIATRGGISASALNDAPTKWAGVAGVKPDQIYTNPREDAASTLNYVEWLAWSEFKAAHPTATEKDWSPERPTNPTRKDTDGDGLTDGYEYYFWYMAHVGYIDEDGVHRYLTGRAYNPRNPGEGDFIDSETLANAFDPQNPTSYKLRDTDNDGLPDELEFLIGTNPIDFDTDGDGLPDGFEIMLGGTDPLLAETTKGVSDAMRNFDGDAMAFTTPYLEANKFVLPVPLHVDTFQKFALVDETGDTDGIQWYVGRTAPTNIVASAETFSGVSFTLTDRTNVTYVTSRTTLPVVDGRLACDLLKSEVRTMISTNDDFGVEGEFNVALMPVLIRAGTPVTNVSESVVEYRTLSLAEDLENASTAWVYGRSVTTVTTGDSLANLGGFGMLAIGRYQTAKAGLELAALPAEDDGVAYLHHFVYQEFGFDPRTAWNANTPLAARWGKTVGEGDSKEVVANNYTANYGYAGVATRTREYTLYDEFLVMSFFLNNGKLSEADVTATQAMPWEKIWSKYTTNGQGPNEPNWEEDNEHFKGRTAETNSGTNGADTDMDGVPDGWELYVMAGPKVEDKETKEFKYNFAAPYNDGFYSSFGPFVKDAAKASVTDNSATGGNASTAGDGDGLTELQEYAGTDSCAYYSEPWGGNEAPFSTTIVRPAEHKDWLNKFFPTDPWNKDTDGDGLTDSAEAGKFKYGKPVDDGKRCAISGGGLNPCTVDTDMDGLPDGWEAQFAGKTVYAGADAQKPKDKDGNEVADGNVLQGYCDGMDGTVPDAFNTPHINTSTGSEAETEVIILNGIAQVVDRDYDKDGLDNWQEYMTGAMRVWRYDDPRSSFDWADKVLGGKAGAIVPDGAFFDDLGNFNLASAMLYTGITDPDEFWYRTLFDRESKWYNPHFITGTAPGTEYFSRVTNGWDQVFTEEGSYYIFFDRQNDQMYKDTWGYLGAAPTKYICTSPIDADTDQDGMDDGYELFHGLNPLLGAAGVLKSSNGPCDIVFDAWYVRPAGSPVDALNNNWTTGLIPTDFDFTVNPWLNGLVDADPDGDDIRNQDEAIMPLVAPSQTWFHTDPTPLWMTDSSYDDSLVTRFFRMPNALGAVPVPEKVEFDGKTFLTRDLDGYMELPLIGPAIAPFTLKYWDVPLAYAPNWMYSFEENEGYDTDHDAGSDFEELQGKVRRKTDPQDADSPRRRQAMYFPGPAEPSALQSMPFVHELYPRAASGYPDDLSFLQYTVECWVRPESTADATVLERTSYVHPSHVADERYVRRNFAIMIRSGKWCTEFDANGTLDASTVRVLGKTDVEPGKWTYVAATYDANNLILYVNGIEDGRTASSLKPEYGSSAVVVYPAGSTLVTTNGAGEGADIVMSGSHSYWFDSEYSLNAFLVGASFTNGDGRQLDVTAGMGFAGRYADFFTGYVDEIRVWDGAQSADVISANHAARKRYTREDAIANRNAFYDEWVSGKLRYRKDGSGKDMDVIPELRFHWTFDSLPGAENAKRVLKAPHGFLDQAKPCASRPSDYEVPWWSGIVGAYKSVYAGERNCWVPWIPNTVTHLPRFDGSTLDSAYWSEDAAGDEPGIYRFARTAEPVSKWTQMVRNLTVSSLQFQTGNRRYWHSYNTGTNGTSMLSRLFEFTGRHLNQTGDDLLPLGGAFAKYVDTMWDDQGASTLWEQTGVDIDNDGLPDWWQEYAEQNYRKDGVPAEGVDITWDTVINYDVGGSRVRITAGEAYLRDLAKGTYLDAAGKVQIGPTDYIQTADADANGIPDWWAEMYGIRGESGLADHDNDGLPNYVEYLLSEVFAFETLFDPTVPDSVQRGIPDYFYRPKGCQLYVGEIFSDHDLVDDAWEDLYDKKDQLDDEIYASRLAWDAFADTDEDGWSNRSENRYAKMVMPIVANEKAHYTPADGLVADYPIPTLSLKLRYNGNRQNAVSAAPIAVQVTTDATLAKDPDATYLIGAAAEQTPGTGTTSDKENTGTEVARTRTIGKWSDRRVIGTLTPGNIKIDSIRLQNCYDPSSTTYAWTITGFVDIFRGTRAEYDDALRKYGSDNVKLVSATAGYKDLQDLKLTSDEKSIVATWTTKTGDTLGTVNLVTGEFELDLGVFKGWTVSDSSDTNRTESTSMEDQTYRIAYATNPSVGLPRELYLGEADTGHVKEGKNSIVAWAETVAADGVWQVGEPYGIVRDVDVSWRGTSAEIELTDLSPVTPRIDLITADSDRGVTVTEVLQGVRDYIDITYGNGNPQIYSNMLNQIAWIEGNLIEPASLEASSFRDQHIRIVRWLVNGVPSYRGDFLSKVILDKKIETDVKQCLTEADILVGDSEVFDLDWKDLRTDVAADRTVIAACGEVTNVSYLVVIGDGPFNWTTSPQTNYAVKALNTVITRKFGRSHVKPVAVAPGAASEEIVHSANPTFKWTMDCPEVEGYTAFNVQVLDGQKVIYDSDKVLAPPRNDKGQYVWPAPLFVGDRTLKGEVFENKKSYTWQVSMYNAKFSQLATYSETGRFFMEVQTNGYDYGSANVAVRYFGPTETWSAKNPVIRVRAYTSPDFTGLPVAAGYVAAPDDPANGLLAGTNAAPNCTVVGIPRGTYYLQAFIDSNGNGACDPWETQGYLCTRDGSKPDSLDPTAITFDSKIGKGDLAIIYLEDADTDGDGLPDAWEVAVYGSLAAKGTELLTETKAGEFVVNTALSGALDLQKNARVPTAGLAGEIRNTIAKLSSPAGVSAATGIDPANVEMTDGGLMVKSEVDPETLTIVGFAVDAAQNRVLLKVGAETTADVNAVVANLLNITVRKGAEVTVRVERAESPAGPWTVVPGVGGTVMVDRAGADIEVKLNGELPAQGFFRARIDE